MVFYEVFIAWIADLHRIFTGANQWESTPEIEAFAIAQNASQINLLGVMK
jgi:hypothetical protein